MKDKNEIWLRSEVEALTGLSKRKVQELCHQNRKTGGMAFWRPFESRPGYSGFDKSDLIAFYIAAKLHKSGFPLIEIKDAFKATLDLGDFDKALFRQKRKELQRRKEEIEIKIRNLDQLEYAKCNRSRFKTAKIIERSLSNSLIEAIYSAEQISESFEYRSLDLFESFGKLELHLKLDGCDLDFENCHEEKKVIEDILERIRQFMQEKIEPESEVVMSFLKELILVQVKEEELILALRVLLEMVKNSDTKFVIEVLCGRGSSKYLNTGLKALLTKEERARNL